MASVVHDDRSPASEGRSDPPSGSGGRHRRRTRLVLAGVVALAVVAVAVSFVLRWRSSGAGQASTEEARRRFEASSTTLPASPAELRPPAGVYHYEGSGTESLSLPPKSQDQGPRMPAVVTHRSDGCWVLRIDYSTNHWQDWNYCPADGGLVERGGATFARWDFVVMVSENLSTFACDPVAVVIRSDMRPGDEWDQRCRGTSTGIDGDAVSSGPITYIGPEVLEIGGVEVAAHHLHQERRLTGAQVGEQTADLWFAQGTGLLLRNERHVRIDTDTPIGRSTYTEDGSLVLTSTSPET